MNYKKYSLVFIFFLISFFIGFLTNNIYSSDAGFGNLALKGGDFINLGDRSEQEQEDKENNFDITDKVNGLFLKKDLELENFWNVYNIISSNYYLQDNIDKEKLVQGAIKGMVDALGDKFSEYMDPEETKKFEDMLSGDFEGIGAVVNKVDGGVEVDRVIKGSPAKEYDIRKGDIILKANGEDLTDMTLYDAVDKIKGPAGTEVILTIFRLGELDLIEKKVIRKKITIPSVDSKDIEGTNLGYIALNMFGENTYTEFKQAIDTMKDKDGIIIDLRDNGGGFLHIAVEVLSEFVENGEVVVETKYKDASLNTIFTSINKGGIFGKPVVILVNENSASASEITAGSLREHNKAILVGKKTYGKGSVQQPFELDDKGLLKVTIGRWYTPSGKNIDLEGVEPDIEVDLKKEDYENQYDRQLEEGKKVLKKYIETGNIAVAVKEYKEESEIDENMDE